MVDNFVMGLVAAGNILDLIAFIRKMHRPSPRIQKSMTPNAPLLRMSGISKRFGATRALRGVSIELHTGQALALVGENGAGKSTLMKVLSGAHSPDEGTMEVTGERYAPRGPHAARAAGVVMIYQELNLAKDLTVE